MTNKYEALKRIVILMYILLTSALLYAISLTDMSSLDETAFSRFAIFFWGGCFSFHYLSMLLPVPANESNSSHWKSLAGQLAILLAIIASTFLLMLGVTNAVLILNLSGLFFGYMTGKAFNFDKLKKRALSIEIGMQNAGLGSVLALKHFNEKTALPAIIFVFICIFSASLLVPIWSRTRYMA